MNKPKCVGVVMLLLAALGSAQQDRRDPLNPLEINKIRDSAMEPEIRLKLYDDFARARLDKLQQARSDAKLSAKDKEQQTHDSLQDFSDIYDELQENVDTFADRGNDLRKALKPVIEADSEFGAKLRAFRSSIANSPEDAGKYEFLLNTALSSVDDGLKDHRQLLAEQEETFKHKKEHKSNAKQQE